MDRSGEVDEEGPGLVSDPAAASDVGSPFKKEGRERSSDVESEEEGHRPKRIKMRHLDCVLRSEGNIAVHLESSNAKDTKRLEHSHEEGTSETTEADASLPSEVHVQATASQNGLETNATSLSLCHVGSPQTSQKLGCNVASEQNKDISRPSLRKEDSYPHAVTSRVLGLDLNAADVSNMDDQNPFHPYKKLGQAKPADASECGSTTGSVGESESLRKWKEMKQNGFISNSHGGIPIPKQRGGQSRRRKDAEHKTRSETAKREQANRFTKIAAPSGLLSGLNPGIIKHVRNSKQVLSIINAMVQSEELDCRNQSRLTDQLGRGGKEGSSRRKEQNHAHADHIGLFSNKPTVSSYLALKGEINMDITEHKFLHGMPTTSRFMSECDDDTLELKLSSAVSAGSYNASIISHDDSSMKQDSVTSLSLKAATVASQWLELLQQDIRGRLAALRRSKRRVRNVIQTELPYLLSTEFSSSQENEPCFSQSSEAGCARKTCSDIHAGRWKSLFHQMDKALCEEGKHLETWLRQVQEMQLHCEKGLKYVGADGLSQVGLSENSSGLKQTDALEREYAVRAAAASIYSTCNLIMTTENVPCF